MANNSTSMKMRIYHRYLGFFLAGIMAVYAISGIILIFRDTDAFKVEKKVSKTIQANAAAEELGQLLKIKKLEVEKTDGDLMYFQNGTYNVATGEANYTLKELPYLIDKMTHLHKAKSSDSLFFLNIFFGLALFFFVVSAFWMFMPKTSVFKKGMYFAAAGLAFAMLLIFIG